MEAATALVVHLCLTEMKHQLLVVSHPLISETAKRDVKLLTKQLVEFFQQKNRKTRIVQQLIFCVYRPKRTGCLCFRTHTVVYIIH